MMPRVLKHLIVLGLFVLTAMCTPSVEDGRAPSEKKPDVIVILVDALRPDRLGCYGSEAGLTPAIDELASRAAVLTEISSTSSWTKSSVPSLFTGLYPTRHQVFEGNFKDGEGRHVADVLSDRFVTMAEAFRTAGYRTGAFLKQPHMTKGMGFDQGFETYREKIGKAKALNRAFFRWLDEAAGSNQPFFAYLHYLDVHWPYAVPPDCRDEDSPTPAVTGLNSPLEARDWKWDVLLGRATPTTGQIERLADRYDASVACLDQRIGELMSGLLERDRLEETIIVFVADHGEEFGEHGRVDHGFTLYREVVWIPLIIRIPGTTDGGLNVEGSASLVDVMPTLLASVKIPAPEGLDGKSFLDNIETNQAIRGRTPVAELKRLEFGLNLKSMEADGYLYVHDFSADRGFLYDVAQDPRLQNDVAVERPELAAEYEERLSLWLDAAGAEAGEAPPRLVLDEGDRESLRALGYVQ